MSRLANHPASPAGISSAGWRPIATAPKDGSGFLAYGLHARDDGRPGRYKAGDHWWAIIQWDVWREPHRFVFGKEGKPISDWGEPIYWQPLLAPLVAGSDGLNRDPDRAQAEAALDIAVAALEDAATQTAGSSVQQRIDRALARIAELRKGGAR